MAAPLRITDEGLRLAFAQRRRAHWPASYEAAMAHPMYSRLVRILAVQAAQQAARRQPLHPTQHRRGQGGIDLKRRASGDTED